jgi:hypothetical protein
VVVLETSLVGTIISFLTPLFFNAVAMVKIRRISSTSSGSSSDDDDNDDSDDSIIEKGCTGSGMDNDSEGGHRPPEPRSGDDEDDEDDERKASCSHCTYAITGNTPTFQAIFVCHACCKDNDIDNDTATKEPLCICQACAEVCHADHEDQVEYIGMGPCYCDCNQLGDCCILAKANLEAERLGMYPKSLKEQEEMIHNHSILTSRNLEKDDTCHEQEQGPPPRDSEKFVQDVYQIPLLLEQLALPVRGEQEKPETKEITSTTSNRTLTDLLINQAHELIRHSKETHWVDQSMVQEENDQNVMTLSPLERLAWSIFQHHVQHYKLTATSGGGAEWWVQVKPASSSRTTTTSAKGHTRSGASGIDKTNGNNHNHQQSDQAIDLHYDKDEALAESFGIGLFPTLSTVTYLTTGDVTTTTTTIPKDPEHSSDGNHCYHNPTLVFPHMYHQGEDEMISSMLLSRPVPGKHLVFDGRLLHGAPSHDALVGSPSAATTTVVTTHGSSRKKEKKRPTQRQTGFVASNDNAHEDNGPLSPSGDESTTFRVTFLVNLWIHRQPTNVQPLEPTVRLALQHKLQEENGGVALTNWLVSTSSDTTNDQTPCPPQQLTMTPSPITEVILDKEDDLPAAFQNRIELPFVTKGITWDEDDYDDSSGLVLTTFPPPARAEDTLMVLFGPGMQAYLEYLHNDEDEDHADGQEPTMSRQTSHTDTKGSSIPVDYRTTIQDCYV